MCSIKNKATRQINLVALFAVNCKKKIVNLKMEANFLINRQIGFFIISFFICTQSVAQSWQCRVEGEISGKSFNDMVYLIEGNQPFLDFQDLKIVDSVNTVNGAFSFKLVLPFTNFYSIRLKNYRKGFVFICSPGEAIKIKFDTTNFYQPKIKGSKENKIRRNYIKGLDPLIVKMNNYADSAVYYMQSDTFKYKRYVDLNDFWSKEIRKYNLSFISKKPKNLTSLSMFSSYYELFTPESTLKFIEALPTELKDNPLVAEIKYKKFSREAELKNVSKFYDIKFYDTLYRPCNLNYYKRKLVLVDFWAAWCKPCIQNFPALKQIQERYKNRDFEIIGVSLDDNLIRWKNGIKNSALSWANISDLKAWNGVVVKYLNISSIPRYVLIGKDGVILNDNLKEDEIEKTLISNFQNH